MAGLAIKYEKNGVSFVGNSHVVQYIHRLIIAHDTVGGGFNQMVVTVQS